MAYHIAINWVVTFSDGASYFYTSVSPDKGMQEAKFPKTDLLFGSVEQGP